MCHCMSQQGQKKRDDPKHKVNSAADIFDILKNNLGTDNFKSLTASMSSFSLENKSDCDLLLRLYSNLKGVKVKNHLGQDEELSRFGRAIMSLMIANDWAKQSNHEPDLKSLDISESTASMCTASAKNALCFFIRLEDVMNKCNGAIPPEFYAQIIRDEKKRKVGGRYPINPLSSEQFQEGANFDYRQLTAIVMNTFTDHFNWLKSSKLVLNQKEDNEPDRHGFMAQVKRNISEQKAEEVRESESYAMDFSNKHEKNKRDRVSLNERDSKPS